MYLIYYLLLTGGTSLAISGSGFGPNITVTVGAGLCDVKSVTYDTIICLTPALVSRSGSTQCGHIKISKIRKYCYSRNAKL